MPEGVNDLDFKTGEPVRAHHRYFIKFTKDRKELYDTIFKYTVKSMNPLQYYHSTDF